MPTSNNIELWNEIRDQAFTRCLDLSRELIDASLTEDGMAFGDREISRGQRILRFQMDAASGAVDILRYQSPSIYEDYVNQYLRDIKDSPLIQKLGQQPPTIGGI
jgi:hypothetical protein